MGLLFKIKNILNFLKTSDLSDRLIHTLLLITLFRLGGFIFLPGVNEEHITRYTDGLLGLLDVFLGGAFSNLSIFGLGVMPYISASIITHLSTLLFPSKAFFFSILLSLLTKKSFPNKFLSPKSLKATIKQVTLSKLFLLIAAFKT